MCLSAIPSKLPNPLPSSPLYIWHTRKPYSLRNPNPLHVQLHKNLCYFWFLSYHSPIATLMIKSGEAEEEGMENQKKPSSLQVELPASEVTRFELPVDSEHKATEFWLFSFAAPHMRAFHLSWFSFFCCFVSTFAAPPLLPVIRDSLGLTTTDIGNAGIASISGGVIARLAMGTACDLVGSRLASASLILLTTPTVYSTAVINSASSYLLVRFFTGFSIASFVSCQFWMSSMFSPPKVGLANGLAGGWANGLANGLAGMTSIPYKHFYVTCIYLGVS